MDERQKRFQKLEHMRWLALPFVAIATYLCWELLLFIFYDRALQWRDDVITFHLPSIIWFIPAFILVGGTAACIVDHLFRRSLGSQWREYLDFRGFNIRKREMSDRIVLRIGLPASTIVCLVASALFGDFYVRFAPTEILANRFWSIREETIPYSAITKIVVQPRGENSEMGFKIYERTLSFRSEEWLWDKSIPTGLTEEEEMAALEEISRRSGIAITAIER